MLAFAAAAGIWRRRRAGGGARIDFSMVEAMLWTMAEPLLATQLTGPPEPSGNDSECCSPHGVYRCAGEDDWISLAVTTDRQWQDLCALLPALTPMVEYRLDGQECRAVIDEALAAWLHARPATMAEAELLRAGIPAAALASARDLVHSKHLAERGFWEPYGSGVLPGLPWRTSFDRAIAPAPKLGADTAAVLREVLDLGEDEIGVLRQSGALG